MKIVQITKNNGLPLGLQRVAAIANKTLRAKKWSKAVSRLPNAVALTYSQYAHFHRVILSEDAIRLSIPTVQHGYVAIG